MDVDESKTSEPTDHPEPNRGGAPAGNTNGVKHGLFSRGAVPSPRVLGRFDHIDVRVDGFRRQLEEAVCEAHGHVTVAASAIIAKACAGIVSR